MNVVFDQIRSDVLCEQKVSLKISVLFDYRKKVGQVFNTKRLPDEF